MNPPEALERRSKNEVRSVTLTPNELNLLKITSEADGLDTPGLKIRTRDMLPNECVIIFPNQEVQTQIAELADDALWNATDAQGNLIVDQTAHSKAEVAAVQNTIKRTMGAIVHKQASTNANSNTPSRIQSSEPVIAADNIGNAWELTFQPEATSRPAATRQAALRSKSLVAAAPVGGIAESAVDNDAFAKLLGQATAANGEDDEDSKPVLIGGKFVSKIRVFRRIKNFVKKAKSVVVGAFKGALNIIVKTAEGIFNFVLDTAQKVAEFVEAVVEKVVKGIKQFIEFLQFLFNWSDILATQRYLANTINAGFAYAKEQVEAVKAPVSAFINDLQDTVEDGMNHLVKALGGEPSEVDEAGFELPEAAEWFLSKLVGGSKKSDAKTTPTVGADPADDTPLESFVRHFLEAFENAVGAAIQLPTGLGQRKKITIR